MLVKAASDVGRPPEAIKVASADNGGCYDH